jgi:hypothetical protein
METYTSDKGEEVVIADMEARRLIHAIAKQAKLDGERGEEEMSELTKALKNEAIKRLTPQA